MEAVWPSSGRVQAVMLHRLRRREDESLWSALAVQVCGEETDSMPSVKCLFVVLGYGAQTSTFHAVERVVVDWLSP